MTTSQRSKSRQKFLHQLQTEAKVQADLSQNYLFPRSLGPLSSFILNHTFFFILITSLLVALLTLALI